MYNAGFEAGASQFNGGGFMPSPGVQAGSGSAQKRSYDQTSQAVRRVTIKQLHQALEENNTESIIVDGKELVNVALVGKILNVKEDNVTFNMLLDDGTGRITVKIFISNDDTDDFEKQKRAELREGIYVRVFGHVSHYNNERQINCFSARPITDHNEVTYHLSQVIFQHLHLLKEEKDNGAPAGALKFDGSGAGGGKVGAGPIPSAVPGGYGFKNGLNPIQSEVLTIFNAPDALEIDVGLTIADVISRSGNRFNQQQVLSAVNYLVEEGHLYSTIDDAHWKSCSS